MWRKRSRILFLIVVAVCPSLSVAQVPTLDSLAGTWMHGDEVVYPPSVTNTTGAIGCTENVSGFRYGMFPPIAQGGDMAILCVDGKPVNAEGFRWYPYQAQRSAKTPNGLDILSTTRLADNATFVLTRIQIKNLTSHSVSANLELRNEVGFRRFPGVWDWGNRGVRADDGFVHRVQSQAESIEDPKTGIVASIGRLPDGLITFRPGESRNFDVLFGFGDISKLSFKDLFDGAKSGWQRRWKDAFTPGNHRYSGNFPTLVTTNEKLKRVYYMALMTMLQMERTNFPHSRRCFVTVGPRWGTTLEYFWDTALFSTTYSLLDPVVFKENLNSWLNIDIHKHYAEDYLTGEGVGPWYSPNDLSVFASFWNYGTTTGDTDFLMANKTHFLAWANFWKERVRPGETLADFGENDNILECGPKYVNMIPSLNAAHVGLMRTAAELCTGDEAGKLNADASSLSKAVLNQYVPGDGVWRTKHRDGSTVVSRHVYDYVTVGLWLTPDLTDTMRKEMTAFVNRELLADGWIRAMSLSDEAAPISDRPDHGPKGSYCAWPAMAAQTMAKFGQYCDMEHLIELCEAATHQGPFPQAFELLQVPGTNRWIPRISLRGADYNETSGAAFAETVIHGLFGIEFGLRGEVILTRPLAARPAAARLLNVRTKSGLMNYECGKTGVRVKQ
jgi:hypothetical protein